MNDGNARGRDGYRQLVRTFIFLAGAPGSGKSSVAAAVQRKLGTPLFEFGWIPEFRNTVLALSLTKKTNLLLLRI